MVLFCLFFFFQCLCTFQWGVLLWLWGSEKKIQRKRKNCWKQIFPTSRFCELPVLQVIALLLLKSPGWFRALQNVCYRHKSPIKTFDNLTRAVPLSAAATLSDIHTLVMRRHLHTHWFPNIKHWRSYELSIISAVLGPVFIQK